MEIRHQCLKPGRRYLAAGQQIQGVAWIGSGIHIDTLEKWEEWKPQHKWDVPQLPYKNTWGLPLMHVKSFNKFYAYQHQKGAMGTATFYPVGVFRGKLGDTVGSQMDPPRVKKRTAAEFGTDNPHGFADVYQRGTIGTNAVRQKLGAVPAELSNEFGERNTDAVSVLAQPTMVPLSSFHLPGPFIFWWRPPRAP